MERPVLPTIMVGNDFVLPQAQLQPAAVLPVPATPVFSLPHVVIESEVHQEFIPVTIASSGVTPWQSFVDWLHRHSLALFIVLSVIAVASGAKVGYSYWVANHPKIIPAVFNPQPITAADLSTTVPAAQLDQKLQRITSQSVQLTVGDQTVPITPDIIKSWLKITPVAGNKDTITVDLAAMNSSLTTHANQFAQAPINQVAVTEDGVSRTVVGGRDGLAIKDIANLQTEATASPLALLGGNGFHFQVETTPQAFATVGPEAFDKLIDANVTTKQTYYFQNGQLVQQYASSDGAPATPTPLGLFHIYAKYTSQDMRGFNPNGTPYFQPHVHWVNYFDGADAVHGVYWHPLSWFGVHNSSHGCVGLPDDEAQWVYNWAPIGTTVITHA